MLKLSLNHCGRASVGRGHSVGRSDQFGRPHYGVNFIPMTSSVYPWFHASRTIGNVIIGTIDELIDDAIAGLIFALLYNAVTSIPGHTQGSHQQA